MRYLLPFGEIKGWHNLGSTGIVPSGYTDFEPDEDIENTPLVVTSDEKQPEGVQL